MFFSIVLSLGMFHESMPIGKLDNPNKSLVSVPYYSLHNESDLNILVKKIGSARIVLLGEASHGTSEFQQWRAAISRKLIEEKGFNLIAVEGDWSEFISVNEFIQEKKTGQSEAVNVLQQFTRWPTWLWSTQEFASFIGWLNAHNQSRKQNDKVKIFGLDLYGIGQSLEAIHNNLVDGDALNALKKVEGCYQPYWNDALSYSTAVHNKKADCSAAFTALKEAVNHPLKNPDSNFIFQQHLQTIINGERYFRTIVKNQAQSWNIRDQHMKETIDRILGHYGKQSKIIIWAHNSHVGDANYTDMPQRGRTNLGELLRRGAGDQNVFIVGSGMYTGDVIATHEWDSSAKVFHLPSAYEGSWDELLHAAGAGDKIVISDEIRKITPLNHWYPQRGIGVVYNSDRPRSPYVPSFISRRYDAYLFIDTSHALTILPQRVE
jgi:erythromycin esterase